MKYLKLFIIMLSLSIPIHSYACWDDDWDDDSHNGWYGDNDWNDDDDLEDDSYDLSGGMLPDVDVYPDDWGYDGWEDDDYWWCSDDDYINGDDDDSWVDEDYDFNYNESNNIGESANIVEDTNANTYSLKKSDKLSLEIDVLNKNKGFKQGTGNTCVAAGLEFAALLFDKKISEGKVLEGLVGNHGLGAIMGIFSNTSQLADDLAKIANQAGLNSEAHIKDIKDAINRGEVVLAPVSVGKNDYHDVVIVGYNEKGYIVYDTDKKGDYVNISEDSVSNMYQVGIKK